MRLKLRLLPMIISAILSAAVLFGGWFIYHSVALENPLIDTVRSLPGVAYANVDVQRDTVVVRLALEVDADLASIMNEIRKSGKDTIEHRTIQLDITSQSSDALDRWWSEALFDVAEAMESRKYADIPAKLEERSGQLPGLEIATSMDESNVYVQLSLVNNSKYIVLPRIPAMMGVWSNE